MNLGSVRDPFGVRSGSVRDPFGSISVPNFRSQKFEPDQEGEHDSGTATGSEERGG